MSIVAGVIAMIIFKGIVPLALGDNQMFSGMISIFSMFGNMLFIFFCILSGAIFIKNKKTQNIPEFNEEGISLAVTLDTEKYPYEKISSIVTDAEFKFLKALTKAVQGEMYIFPKVGMADILKVIPESNNQQGYRNKIEKKHVDFVLCEKKRLNYIAAIELDDSSHKRKDRVKRDKFVNNAFREAKLPLIRIDWQNEYNIEYIKNRIQEALIE